MPDTQTVHPIRLHFYEAQEEAKLTYGARNQWMPLCGEICAQGQACTCVFSVSILGWVVTVYTVQCTELSKPIELNT